MRRTEYLGTFKGQHGLYQDRRIKSLPLGLKGDGFAKGVSKAKELAVIKDVMGQMKAVGRTCIRTREVACQIVVDSSAKDLATTYDIAKNYLDLMGKKWVQKNKPSFKKSELQRLPYIDDRQISYLAIQRWDSGSDVSVRFDDFDSFLRDICFAYEIRSGKYKEVNIGVVDWQEDCDGADLFCEELKDRFENKSKYTIKENAQEYRKNLELCGLFCQDSILKNRRLNLDDLYVLLAHRVRFDKFKTKESRELLKGHHFPDVDSFLRNASGHWMKKLPQRKWVIRLPVPAVNCLSKDFESKVRQIFHDHKNKSVYWNEMFVPVGVQIMYKPYSKEDPKDLDNLSREILPLFQEVFKPIELNSLSAADAMEREERVPSFEAIKLPSGDKDNCFILFSFFSGMTGARSLWSEAEDVIEKARDVFDG